MNLCLRIVLINAALLSAMFARADETSISAEAAHAAAQRGGLILVDVRSPDEWLATGTPRGAIRISIEQSFDEQDFVDQVLYRLKLDRTLPIALICSGGERSRRASRLLENNGFTDVHWIREGVRAGRDGQRGWVELGLPVDP